VWLEDAKQQAQILEAEAAEVGERTGYSSRGRIGVR